MSEFALELSREETTETLRICPVEADRIDVLLESGPRPLIFVMETSALGRLMRSKGASGRIAPLKARDPRKGLAAYLKGEKPVALDGNYKTAAKLLTSVRNFLLKEERAGDRSLHFLGVSQDLFDELAAEAPDDVREHGEPTEGFPDQPAHQGEARLDEWAEGTMDWRETFKGKSPAAQKVRRLIEVAANAREFADVPVLILGPTGAGKEVVAKAIHHLGRGAAGGRFVDVNCAAIAPDMFEAELFGVAPDAATGVAARVGLWELASKERGTLLLDEVGELSLPHQAKILRALEEGTVRRIGGRENIPVSARMIASTNRELFAMARHREFRDDLAQRLARVVIRVPGLAERRDDIEAHAQEIWREKVTQQPDARLSSEIISILSAHSWPGSVRELQGLLETTYALRYGDLSPDADALYEAWEIRGDSPLPGANTRSVSDAGISGERRSQHEAQHSLDNEIRRFNRIRPRYERFAGVLERILEAGVRDHAPLSLIETRAKSVARVAEILQRSGDLVEALPDLCGGRVVVHTREQATRIVHFIERYFEVESKSIDQSDVAAQVLGSGYHPVRLVVSLDETRAKAAESVLGVKVPNEVCGLEAEIEVRTVLEDAWANVNHEMGRDVPLPLPERWRQELDELSRVLQAVDVSFSRLRAGFRTYRTTYPAQLTLEETLREIDILDKVLEYDPDPSVAVRLAKLAISIEDWDRAIETLESHAEAGYQPALRDMGVAICQKHRLEPESAAHQRGQALLTRAAADVHADPDAMASLAGTLKRSGEGERAREYYGRAHTLDPGDPYALWGLLEMEMALTPDVDFPSARAMDIERATARCRDQAAAEINLPWAWFDLGKFTLLRDDPIESLEALRRGIACSRAGFMIQTTIESLDRIAGSRFAPSGLGEAQQVLRDGLTERFPEWGGIPSNGDG
ncbi:MAG: sigma 54-interacting transcriptional regulator [bacterium]|nr:sigma 54-interacting transcriptional regulator [bacterium]